MIATKKYSIIIKQAFYCDYRFIEVFISKNFIQKFNGRVMYMKGRCVLCEYYKEFMKSYGNCHFNPPGIDGKGMSVWPKVHEDDWCAHFKQGGTTGEETECSPQYVSIFRKTFGIDPHEIDFRVFKDNDIFTVMVTHIPTSLTEMHTDPDRNQAKTKALEKLIQAIKKKRVMN